MNKVIVSWQEKQVLDFMIEGNMDISKINNTYKKGYELYSLREKDVVIDKDNEEGTILAIEYPYARVSYGGRYAKIPLNSLTYKGD